MDAVSLWKIDGTRTKRGPREIDEETPAEKRWRNNLPRLDVEFVNVETVNFLNFRKFDISRFFIIFRCSRWCPRVFRKLIVPGAIESLSCTLHEYTGTFKHLSRHHVDFSIIRQILLSFGSGGEKKKIRKNWWQKKLGQDFESAGKCGAKSFPLFREFHLKLKLFIYLFYFIFFSNFIVGKITKNSKKLGVMVELFEEWKFGNFSRSNIREISI